jgi:hypothetical protein
MKRIILFRYHANPLVCVDRLELLKKNNPDIPIYGIYGGIEEEFQLFKVKLKPYLEAVLEFR